MALILVQVVFLAVRARSVFQLRLADPAAVFIPFVFGAPEPTVLSLGCVAFVAGRAIVVRVCNGCFGITAIAFARCTRVVAAGSEECG
jgi:hypothetical protein